MINIIVAVTRGGGIGRGGDMLFHIPADLRYFRDVTMGHTVVMGRRTWESLPKGALPGRRNIVITRNPDFEAHGAEVCHSLDEALALVSGQVYIIGGAQIYAQALPMADKLYITEIDAETPEDADTFFPAFDPERFPFSEVSPMLEGGKTAPRVRFTVRQAAGR